MSGQTNSNDILEAAKLQAKQLEITAQQSLIITDHEKRIRFLERTIGYGLGALGVVTWLISKYGPH